MSPRPDLGPKPRLGYTASVLDRAAERRTEPAALGALASDPRAGVYVIGGEMVVLKKGSPTSAPLFAPAEAHALSPAGELIFLGLFEGRGRFAVACDAITVEGLKARDDLIITDLRTIAIKELVEAHHLPPIAEGKALLHWHARHR